MAKTETQQILTMVNFFQTKYQADLPTMLGRLVGGGITLALGPKDSALLIVDAEDTKMLEEIHDFFRTIAKGEATKQGNPDRVASADYRGVTGWTFAPGESHAIIGSRLLLANRPEATQGGHRSTDRSDGQGRDPILALPDSRGVGGREAPGDSVCGYGCLEAIAGIPERPDSG